MIGNIPGPKAMVKYELRALKQIGLIGCGGFGTVTLQRSHSQFLRWQGLLHALLPEYFSGPCMAQKMWKWGATSPETFSPWRLCRKAKLQTSSRWWASRCFLDLHNCLASPSQNCQPWYERGKWWKVAWKFLLLPGYIVQRQQDPQLCLLPSKAFQQFQLRQELSVLNEKNVLRMTQSPFIIRLAATFNGTLVACSWCRIRSNKQCEKAWA